MVGEAAAGGRDDVMATGSSRNLLGSGKLQKGVGKRRGKEPSGQGQGQKRDPDLQTGQVNLKDDILGMLMQGTG
jgi:hypothetical protein